MTLYNIHPLNSVIPSIIILCKLETVLQYGEQFESQSQHNAITNMSNLIL